MVKGKNWTVFYQCKQQQMKYIGYKGHISKSFVYFYIFPYRIAKPRKSLFQENTKLSISFMIWRIFCLADLPKDSGYCPSSLTTWFTLALLFSTATMFCSHFLLRVLKCTASLYYCYPVIQCHNHYWSLPIQTCVYLFVY